MQINPQTTQMVADLSGESFKDVFYTICDSSRDVRHTPFPP